MMMRMKMMINALVNLGVCCVLVSEENEEPSIVPPGKALKYCVDFDPLDGFSDMNIDYNVSVGTIISIDKRKPGSSGIVNDLLKSEMGYVCTGFLAAEMVFTFQGGNVHGFCLDRTIGNRSHTHETMVLPDDGGEKIYCVNQGKAVHWDKPIRGDVDRFKYGDKAHILLDAFGLWILISTAKSFVVAVA